MTVTLRVIDEDNRASIELHDREIVLRLPLDGLTLSR